MKRLRFVADLNPKVSGLGKFDAGRAISFIPLESVWSDERFDPSRTMEFGGDVQSYNPVAEGDLLVPKVSPTFAHGRCTIARGLVGDRALATSEVFVLRARDPGAAPFLKYRLLARDFLSEGQAAWYGVAGLKRISADFLLDVRINDEAWRNRGAIADFLDRECARIDELRGELAFLESSLAHASESSLAALERAGVVLPPDLSDRPDWGRLPTGWKAVLLGRAVRQLTNGYVGPTRDVLVPDGVRYIQSTHIKGGRIEFDRRPFYVPENWHDARPRIHLTAGDVLIVQTGKLGEVALVPDDFGPASCHALLIARVEPSLMSGAYLAAWFSTYFGRHSLLRMATGALHPHLEAGEIRKLQILIPARDVQQEFVAAAGVGQVRRRRMENEIDAFRRRLADYRDALITEAVTGQLDVINLRDSEMAESLAAVGEGEPPGVLAR